MEKKQQQHVGEEPRRGKILSGSCEEGQGQLVSAKLKVMTAPPPPIRIGPLFSSTAVGYTVYTIGKFNG